MPRPAHPTEIRAEGNDDAMRQTLYGFCCRNNKDLLLLQWDTEKNAPDTPQTVSYGSQRKMWWHCEKGHSWQTAVYVRTSGAGCPYCTGRKVVHPGFNDLASKAPAVAAQWPPTLNGNLTPEMVTVSSHRRVWWQCPRAMYGRLWSTPARGSRNAAVRSAAAPWAGPAGPDTSRHCGKPLGFVIQALRRERSNRFS